MSTFRFSRLARKRSIHGSQESLTVSLFHLTHLLQAGVSLSDALSTVCELESGYRMRRIWTDVYLSVNSGRSLSAAMSLWPAVFPPVLLALLKAGEANAQLGQACEKSMELLEWQSQLKSRLSTALVYPLFAFMVMLGVVSFLFVAVVPSLSQFLLSTHSAVSWHTQWLFALSEWLSLYLLPSVSIVILFVLMASIAGRLCSDCGLVSDAIRLRVPLLGRIWTSLLLSRYASTSSQLYASGVQLEHSLKLGEGLVNNKVLRNQLRGVRKSLVGGSGLSRSMEGATLIPLAFRKLLAAGEASGALEQALQRAGAQQQRLAELAIGRTEALIGPVLLLLIGVNLLWIVISIIGPVYNSAIDAVVFS